MEEARRIRPVPVALGLILLGGFFEAASYLPFQATAGVALDYVGPLEYRFWLAHATMALPGVLLLSWGLAPVLAPTLTRLWHWGLRMPSRSWFAMGLGYFALLLIVAIVGRELFLLGLPITDDEGAVGFGAKIIASGHLSVPILEPQGAYNQIYTVSRDGLVFSMEYPGALLVGALAIVSGLGSVLYALLAASTGWVVVAAASSFGGRRAAMVTAAVWLCSPMARMLSMTTHNHIASQFFAAIAIWMYCRIAEGGDRTWKTAAALGVSGTAMFLTRSVEAAFILAPILCHLGWLSIRKPELRLRLLLAASIALIGMVFYAWYNLQTIGGIAPARFAAGIEGGAYSSTAPDYAARFGGHLAHNWMMLCVLGLGPAGLIFISFAKRPRSGLVLVLGSSAIGLLLLSLLHDNIGIHTVGPIHLSDLVPIMVLLASIGILRMVSWVGKAGLRKEEGGLAILSYLVIGLGIFICFQGASMRAQANVQAAALDVVAAVVEEPALVLAPPAPAVRGTLPEFALAGSWVLRYPQPDPFLQVPVIFAKDRGNLDALLARFPKRNVYRLTYVKDVLPVKVTRIR